MTLKACIPGLVERGEISHEQGAEMTALFDSLYTEYRRQFGDAAASAKASHATVDAMDQAAAVKRAVAVRQMAAQDRALRARDAYGGGPNDPRWTASVLDRDAQSTASNVEGRRKAIRNTAHAQMTEILATFHRNVLGVIREPARLADMTAAIFDPKAGSVAARELAEAWTKTAETLRQRWNSAVGWQAIGKLDYGYLPQNHDSVKVRAAGYDAWRAVIDPLLDRAKIIDRRTSAPMGDVAFDAAMRDAFETIRTDGWSKRAAGGVGKGMLAKSRSDARFLHFKDGAAWQAYADAFGKGTVFDAMMGHIDGMSRDIAALEILGPNPTATLAWMKDVVQRDAALDVSPGSKGIAKAGSAATHLDELWDEYTGANQIPDKLWLAQASGAVRAFATSTKLGSALLSAAPGDFATSAVTAKFNGLPFTKAMGAYIKLLDPTNDAHRKLAAEMALGAEGWASHHAATMRTFSAETTGEIASRVAEGVLRISGLNAHTEAARAASGMMLFGHLADVHDLPFDKLGDRFQGLLSRYGIGPESWDAIRSTPLRKREGQSWLFAKDVADPALGDRLLEMAATEVDYAVPVADLQTRALIHGMSKKGTWRGEAVSQAMLFKSFGLAMLLTHGRRALQQADWRVGASYATATLISLTMAGALSEQLSAIAKGQDPMPMDSWDFWGKALARGGGFGLIGDVFTKTVDPRIGGLGEFAIGPAAGDLAKVVKFGKSSAYAALDIRSASGKPANPGRDLVKLLQSAVPGDNLWYTRLAYQRLLLDQLSENIDPDYRQSWKRMAKRAQDQRTEYYWNPGETAPERLPDFANAMGSEQ